MNSIAILTFHAANNFGAVLQAYALQEFLSQNFAPTRILDYRPTSSGFSLADVLHTPKKAVRDAFQAILFFGKNRKIAFFRKNCLRLTQHYTPSSIRTADGEADLFVVGSDQVWNPMIVGRDTTFFLDFAGAGKKTCSYAASIGIPDFPPDIVDLYRKALAHVGTISVREPSAIRTLATIGVHCNSVMPDPVVLLPGKDWEKLVIPPKPRKKFILVYKITRADNLLQFAKSLSEKTGLSIVYIPNDLKAGVIGSLKLDVGPREWLGYIRNAEYVVTNSFHGTLFSIVFGIPFFSEISASVNPSTSRLLSLLELFGLENRTTALDMNEACHLSLPLQRMAETCAIQRRRALEFFKSIVEGNT